MLDTSVGSLNQGDEIINLSVRKNWPEIFENNYVYKMATHTPIYSLFQCFYKKKAFHSIEKADFKFLCGTNALYINMLRPVPAWNITIFNTSLIKGTVCLGVGIGANSKEINWYTRKLYDIVLSKKYIHSTRDEATKEFLIKLGFKAVNTGCPTLWGLTDKHCVQIPRHKSDKVVFTLTGYTPNIRFDKQMVDVLLKNYNEVYFWPQCIDDYYYLKQLKIKGDIRLVSPNVNGYDKLLNTGIDYVGNRLHGGIYALQHKCRSIIISIDYRAEEMKKNFSIPCLKRDDIDTQLEEYINSKWDTRIGGLDFDLIADWKSQFL